MANMPTYPAELAGGERCNWRDGVLLPLFIAAHKSSLSRPNNRAAFEIRLKSFNASTVSCVSLSLYSLPAHEDVAPALMRT